MDPRHQFFAVEGLCQVIIGPKTESLDLETLPSSPVIEEVTPPAPEVKKEVKIDQPNPTTLEAKAFEFLFFLEHKNQAVEIGLLKDELSTDKGNQKYNLPVVLADGKRTYMPVSAEFIHKVMNKKAALVQFSHFSNVKRGIASEVEP